MDYSFYTFIIAFECSNNLILLNLPEAAVFAVCCITKSENPGHLLHNLSPFVTDWTGSYPLELWGNR